MRETVRLGEERMRKGERGKVEKPFKTTNGVVNQQCFIDQFYFQGILSQYNYFDIFLYNYQFF